MTARSRFALAVLLLAAVPLVAGCGEEQELEVIEGEPVELGELRYNVQITRFLNANDPEDEAFLAGQPDPAPDQGYLAVFMTVENEGDSPVELPDEMKIEDTRGNTYEPLDSKSVFALDLGSAVPAGGKLPAPGTPAANGPINGAMALFLVDRTVTENRPIELEIPSPAGDETARVELDI